MVKNPPAMRETWVRKIPLEEGMQPTPVFLPGESPWTEETEATAHEASKSRTRLTD